MKRQLAGVRHLILGFKKISEQECEEFQIAFNRAKLSPLNKEGRIESLLHEYDSNLKFLGILGIEDSISSSTVECISMLKSAGIKFGLLIGDS